MKIEQEKDLSEVKVKRVIICCNGFINTKKHNLKSFKDYFETINTDENNEVCLISLYSPEDKTTYNRNKQYNVLKSKIDEYVQKIISFTFLDILIQPVLLLKPLQNIQNIYAN